MLFARIDCHYLIPISSDIIGVIHALQRISKIFRLLSPKSFGFCYGHSQVSELRFVIAKIIVMPVIMRGAIKTLF